MLAQIQFGENWVKVKNSIFYVPPHAVKVLKMWYRHELKYNTNASEKFIVDMLEYLAKAFTLLNPQNRDEAIYFLALLEDAYAVADYVMELIDRIYANRNTNMMVREL